MEPGQLIGQYRLESLIAEGGMGSVWRAHHPTLDRLVAIKFVKTGVRENAHAREAFMREVRNLSRLHGPQIVHVLDFGFTDEGDPYMVTEFLEGEDLLSRLRTEKQLSIRETVFIGIEVLKALAEAHALGLIHRDLKPGNIFLQRLAGGARMAVKVLDFGVSKLLSADGDEENTIWPDGSPKGSPRYMAPEQVLCESVTAAADMYAFGATLYRSLSGEPVFAGSIRAMMTGHVRQTPESLRTRFPQLGVPAELDDIILGCLAKDPAERPGSADALQTRLERLLQTIPEQSQGPVEAGDYHFAEVAGSPSKSDPITTLSSGEALPGWLEPSLAPTGETSLAEGGRPNAPSDSNSGLGAWGQSSDDAPLELAFEFQDVSGTGSGRSKPVDPSPSTPSNPVRTPQLPETPAEPRHESDQAGPRPMASEALRPEYLIAATVLLLVAVWFFSRDDPSLAMIEGDADATVEISYDLGRLTWLRRQEEEPVPAVIRTGNSPVGPIDAAVVSVRVRAVPGPASFRVVATGEVICKNARVCDLPIDLDIRVEQKGHRPKILSGDDLYDRRNGTWRIVLQER